jgi:hypothetical protein
MMHLNSGRIATSNLLKFDGIISEKQSSIINLTKVVVILSVLFTILMIVSM